MPKNANRQANSRFWPRFRPISIVCLLGLLIAGCAGGVKVPGNAANLQPVDPLFADLALSGPVPQRSRVIFYRPSEAFFVAVEPQILVNGKSVGRMPMGAAFYRDALPGFYKVHLEYEDDDAVVVEAKAGEIVFLRTRLVWDLLGYVLRVEPVDAKTGAEESVVLRWRPSEEDGAPFTYRRDAPAPAAD